MEDVFKLTGKISVENSEANKSIDDTTKKAETAATKISKGFEKAGTFLNNVGQKITGAGKVMTATLTTGFAGLVASGIKYNAQMEEFQMNLTTLLGSSDKATKLLSDLKEMAATTPFETTDLIKATETMIGFGISAQDSQKYLGYLGDISMGNSEKLKGLSLAFAQVQSTGKLTGQDLLQMINQGFNPLLYISKMTGKSMATLKEEMSDGAISAQMVADAFAYATKEGQPFYNAMENGATTINGRISTLKDNFQMLVGSITESLLPTFEKIVNKAIELTEKFNSLSQEQKENILKWGAIVAAIGPALIVFGKVTSAIGSISTALGKFTALEKVSAGITKFVGACGGTVGALGAVAGIVALVASVFVFLKRNWDKVTEVFQNFIQNTGLAEKFEEIKSKLEPLVEKFKGLGDLFEVVGGFIVTILQPAIAILAGAFNGIVSAISPLLDALGGVLDVLGGIGTFIKSVFTGDMEGAKNALVKIKDGIVSIFSGLWDAVVGFLEGFLQGLIGWVQGLFDALGITEFFTKIGTAISEWWAGVLEWLNGIWTTICDVVKIGVQLIASIFDAALQIILLPFTFIWENCKEYIIAFIDKAKELIGTVVSWIVEKFNFLKEKVLFVWGLIKQYIIQPIVDTYNRIKEVIGNVVSWVVDKFNNLKSKATSIFSSIKDNIVSKITDLKNKVTNIFNKVKDAMEKPIQKARDTIKNMVDKIKSMFSGLKLKFPNIKLPHFGISPKGWEIGDLLKGKIPKLKIDWYAKAMNNPMILDKPTAFGMSPNGDIRAGGEAGKEVVAGANTLMNMISESVASQNESLLDRLEAIVRLLINWLPRLANMQLVTDTGVLIGELAPGLDEELGKIRDRKERGR